MNEYIDLSKYQGKKLIAFDLYGTCIDHHLKIIRLSRDLLNILKTNPITIQDIQEGKVEIGGNKIKIDQNLIDLIRRDIERTFLYPETLETLEKIKRKGYKIAVVSNLSKDYAEPLYRLFPEGIFDYKILSFEVGATKSDTDSKIYEKLKTESGIDFKDMIMVGDNLKADVIGSYKVGITPIHLNRDNKGIKNDKGIKEVKESGISFVEISALDKLEGVLGKF